MSRSYREKPWNNPPKDFKVLFKRRRRAREKHALKTGKEIPKWKHEDKYNWT